MEKCRSVFVNPAFITNSTLAGVGSPDVPAFASPRNRKTDCQQRTVRISCSWTRSSQVCLTRRRFDAPALMRTLLHRAAVVKTAGVVPPGWYSSNRIREMVQDDPIAHSIGPNWTCYGNAVRLLWQLTAANRQCRLPVCARRQCTERRSRVMQNLFAALRADDLKRFQEIAAPDLCLRRRHAIYRSGFSRARQECSRERQTLRLERHAARGPRDLQSRVDYIR